MVAVYTRTRVGVNTLRTKETNKDKDGRDTNDSPTSEHVFQFQNEPNPDFDSHDTAEIRIYRNCHAYSTVTKGIKYSIGDSDPTRLRSNTHSDTSLSKTPVGLATLVIAVERQGVFFGCV